MRKKYEKAYDSKLNKWVTPEELDIADRYDKPRYYSTNINEDGVDSGVILTYRKETKEIAFKRPELHPDKTGYTRKNCFCEYCKNTQEDRERIDRQLTAQESSVHKIAKEVAKSIKYIKVPAIKVELLGEEHTILSEQIIKVKFVEIEKKDAATGRIPDIIFETNYLGVKEKLYLEIFYRHPVEQDKKQQFRDNNINCIEVNISDLRSDIGLSVKVLKSRIIKAIEEDCYWISNAYSKHYSELIEQYIIDINSTNCLKRSFEANHTNDERFFIFKDDYHELSGVVCTNGSRVRSINIGDCKKCKRCLYIKNENSDNIFEVHIYCFKEIPRASKLNIIKMLNYFREKAISRIENNDV